MWLIYFSLFMFSPHFQCQLRSTKINFHILITYYCKNCNKITAIVEKQNQTHNFVQSENGRANKKWQETYFWKKVEIGKKKTVILHSLKIYLQFAVYAGLNFLLWCNFAFIKNTFANCSLCWFELACLMHATWSITCCLSITFLQIVSWWCLKNFYILKIFCKLLLPT